MIYLLTGSDLIRLLFTIGVMFGLGMQIIGALTLRKTYIRLKKFDNTGDISIEKALTASRKKAKIARLFIFMGILLVLFSIVLMV